MLGEKQAGFSGVGNQSAQGSALKQFSWGKAGLNAGFAAEMFLGRSRGTHQVGESGAFVVICGLVFFLQMGKGGLLRNGEVGFVLLLSCSFAVLEYQTEICGL